MEELLNPFISNTFSVTSIKIDVHFEKLNWV